MSRPGPGRVVVAPASPAERPVIGQLLQLYLHDISAFAAAEGRLWDVDDSGYYRYPYLDRYWSEAGRHPFLIRVDRCLAGYALVNRFALLPRALDHAMAEFFILKRYRRQGIGRAAVHDILMRLPGVWEIAVFRANVEARQFWRRVATEAAAGSFKEHDGDGKAWRGPILRFRV